MVVIFSAEADLLVRPAASFDLEPSFDGIRARNKRRTRSAIRSSALELFARQGYGATTVEQIANLASVSSRTFFNYFASKEQCVTFPHEEFAAPLRAAFLRRPLDEPPLTSFREACKEMFGWIERHEPARAQVIEVARLINEPELHGTDSLFRDQWEESVTHLFAGRGVDPATSRLLAIVGIGVWKTAAQLWATNGATGSLVDGIERGFDALVHAVGPSLQMASSELTSMAASTR
jgi:AcrR family transcriptional regulator